jgi:serine/threonine protein kinase
VQQSLGRTVAIKVLSSEAWARGHRRIEGEARALARLKHPQIVAIHEFALTNQVPYLVMEWVGGGSLQDRIDRGPLAVEETVLLLLQLSRAVQAVHALGIIHRDLKPANVLLEQALPGTPLSAKLTDFGLARDCQELRKSVSETVVGTPAYMSPEQTGLVDAVSEPTPACDIYGLGAIAYACLAGRPPHLGRSTLETLVRVASDEPASITSQRREVPDDVSVIIAKCLRTRADDRYGSVAELAADLDRFLEGRPIIARPYTLTERGLKWIRRRPAPAMAFGLLVGAVISGSVYHMWRQSETLRELALEKRKVDAALQEATAAAATERRLKGRILEQLTLSPKILMKFFGTAAEMTEEHHVLMLQIREAFRRQAADPRDFDPQIAEVVSKGLAALSHSEEFRFGSVADSLADLDLSLAVARRFPGSETLRDLEADLLLLRYRQAVRLGQSERAADTVDEILRLCGSLEESPEPPLGTEKVVFLASTLFELRRPAAALPLVTSVVGRYQQLMRRGAGDPEDWGRLLNSLILQAGLQNELGDYAGADATIENWKSALQEARSWHSGIEQSFPDVEFELTLMRLVRAGRRGDRDGVRQLLSEGRRLIVERQRGAFPAFQSALWQLRLTRVVLEFPSDGLESQVLEADVSEVLAYAEKAHRTRAEQAVLQQLAAEIRRLRDQRGDFHHSPAQESPSPLAASSME